jgi:predicted nucleic acid-binding protein
VVVEVSLLPTGLRRFRREELVAPPLLWPEVRASLHQAVWRGDLAAARALEALGRFEASGIASRSPAGLGGEAWRLADEFGWAKTYDAEYVALAQLLRCRLVTLDAALRRSTARLGFVVSPAEI